MELVKEQISNHDLFTKWSQEWRKLNEEISDLKLDEVLIESEADSEDDERQKKLRRPSSKRSRKKSKG
jgi:hypothetical protein